MKRIHALVAAVAVVAALALAQAGLAGPAELGAFFFGPKLVRAEVVVADGGTVRDYRVDRGRLRAVTAAGVSLLEKDGTVVTVPVAADARIQVGGRPVPPRRLQRAVGAVVTTVREGDAAASIVQVGQ